VGETVKIYVNGDTGCVGKTMDLVLVRDVNWVLDNDVRLISVKIPSAAFKTGTQQTYLAASNWTIGKGFETTSDYPLGYYFEIYIDSVKVGKTTGDWLIVS
jgi:hypothetical protein